MKTTATALQSTDHVPAPIFTSIPIPTPLPQKAIYAAHPVDGAENIVYYFAPEMYNAKWTNNGQELPCPGVEGQIKSGYAGLLAEADLGLPYKANALLTIPAQDGNFFGIFGRFPARRIEFADFFRVQLYCPPEILRSVAFSLGYYDSKGKFYEPFPFWPYFNYVDLPILINLPLDILAGQTVQLTLIVRDNGDPVDDFAVWVEPHIFRHPDISTPTP